MPTTFAGLVVKLIDIISLIIPFLITLTFVVMIWKVINSWVLHADDPAKRDEGRMVIVAGVIALVCIMIVWGAVALLRNSLF